MGESFISNTWSKHDPLTQYILQARKYHDETTSYSLPLFVFKIFLKKIKIANYIKYYNLFDIIHQFYLTLWTRTCQYWEGE